MAMFLFISVFFLIYGGAHFYVFLKIKKAFLLGPAGGAPVAAFMLLMVLTPFLVRWSEKFGFEALARTMSFIGYGWMGLFLFFFSASFVIDVIKLLIPLGGFLFKKQFLLPSARLSFYVPLLIAVSAGMFAVLEARHIKTERLTIKTSGLPEGIRKLRVVQISDLHTGLIIKGDRLERILDEVKKTEPDMLVSTGDLVDGQVDSLMKCVVPFKEITPRFGKYAVTGNHEFYAGLKEALAFTEAAGFRVLRGEAVTDVINIAGIDDRQANAFGLYRGVSEKALLSGLPREKFTLLLKHRPVIDKDSPGLFDLQLSGHTHRGQLFPFSLIVRLFYKYFSGTYNIRNGSSIHVSRGTGTWGPPMRLFSSPEITVIELVRP